MDEDRLRWVVIVPQKSLTAAKSRMKLPAEDRAELALAMLGDTVDVALACEAVMTVVVVWQKISDCDPDLFHPVVRHISAPGVDLNGAIRIAETQARRAFPRCARAAMPGDLPAAHTAELGEAFTRAARHRRAFLTDATGEGTTMLFASQGSLLRPAYGTASAAWHAASGAYGLPADGLSSLRRDVDDLETLTDVVLHGCGSRTTYVCWTAGIGREAALHQLAQDHDRSAAAQI